jgi:5-methylthioadenosine/S-adenosylhomocysteine deaminase
MCAAASRSFTSAACILALWGGIARAQDAGYALVGTVVAPQGVIENGSVYIAHGAIQELGEGIALPAGTPVIHTGGVIFPGLIDLHNHLTWNVFPRWNSGRPVGDRYDWQAMADYAATLSGPEATLVNRGDGCDMERYAELKALLGGATSVVGSFSPTDADPHRNDCDRGLARNLDFASGLYSSNVNAEPLDYEVFPFEIPFSRAQSIRDSLSSGKLKVLLIHVAEGKDASAAREFSMLEATGFLRPGVSIIQGVALHPADFHEMAAKGVGLIWSPHGNFALYGTTTNVAAAKKAGVRMAIAPDWSPTGSDGMTEELHYAYKWNQMQKPRVFAPSELVEMATTQPAELAAVSDKIGSLTKGTFADVVVFPKMGESPWAALLNAAPGSIKLVVIGGKPLLGEPKLMKQLLPGSKLETLHVCSYDKSLNLEGETNGETWAEIDNHLKNELERLHIQLAELANCSHP